MTPPAHETGPEPATPPTEPDSAPYGKLVIGFVVVLVVFGGAVAVTWGLQAPSPRRGPLPPPAGQPEISTVDQTLFDRDQRAYRSEEEKRARLASYGWVDPDAGVAHLPIDTAMDLLLGARRPDGGTR